ncbi:hypothetical protein J6590_081039 [Homalodisca vitripennis]|nr:hypothetical protein J6590_081039 [Homalodisca vitripennis]
MSSNYSFDLYRIKNIRGGLIEIAVAIHQVLKALPYNSEIRAVALERINPLWSLVKYRNINLRYFTTTEDKIGYTIY